MATKVNPNSALEQFRKVFLRPNKPITEEPLMPKSLAKLNGEKLSDLMNSYTAWREYADDCLLDYVYKLAVQKEEYEYRRNLAFLSTRGKSLRDRDMQVDTDPEIRNLYRKLLETEMYHDLLAGKIESYTNCLTMISREITRRNEKY